MLSLSAVIKCFHQIPHQQESIVVDLTFISVAAELLMLSFLDDAAIVQ